MSSARFQHGRQFVEGGGLCHFGALDDIGQRLAQGLPKQGMIIDNDDA